MPTVIEDLDTMKQSDAKMGVFDLAILVLTEAASIASNIPYMGPIAGVFLQIVRIRAVRFCWLLLSRASD